MTIDTLPREVLDLILGQLIERPTPYQYCDTDKWRDNVHHLCQARLVCHRWSSLATPHLFRNIVLAYTDKDTTVWDNILDSELVHHARSLHIRSNPLDEDKKALFEDWKTDRYDAVLNSAKRIEELQSVEALHLRFSRHCDGLESLNHREIVQDISMRQQMLDNVFGAMHNRCQVGRNARPIRSLTIENLQNVPLPEFTSSDVFKDVMRDVTHLHLKVQEEYNEHGPDWDMYCVERRTFEPHLHRAWLTPLSDQLVSLSLYFSDCWGAIPAHFDGKGLSFPRLETLALGQYVIGHHHQFDWVLNQTSLTTLYMDKCAIVSYIAFCDQNDWEKWDVPTHDWVAHPRGSFGFDVHDLIWTFSGTWEPVFDGIRTSLPNLRDFRFHGDFDDPVFPVRPEMLSVGLHKMRYCAFDGDWEYPTSYYDAKPGVLLLGTDVDTHVNRAEETEEGDGRALEALLEEIRKR